MSTELSSGMEAPAFQGVAVGGAYGPDGKTVRSGDLLGKTVVLYFYPKDETPGCTTQACGLRDEWDAVCKTGAEVFGVSVDSVESHRDFLSNHRLPFALISDEDHRIVEAFGVWVEKSMYGRKFMGTERTTFVIRPDGRIKSVHRRVDPAKHVGILLEDLANFKP